ncbi:hypothetical protein EUTSA_v10000581mg [Eutrema salsugineum]|uniref:Uncharacterized protein n=1 Tax=Eutrema salsugineum TaxID=72664 RepID=V4LRS5_EUTSA|nr:hypothetical protein EUTSA_v10000581mg [Eutrema salsugineum]
MESDFTTSLVILFYKFIKRFQSPPSKTSQAKPDQVYQKPIQTLRELFAGSVTMGAAPSPRHVPVPMFCFTEKFN